MALIRLCRKSHVAAHILLLFLPFESNMNAFAIFIIFSFNLILAIDDNDSYRALNILQNNFWAMSPLTSQEMWHFKFYFVNEICKANFFVLAAYFVHL